jgi:hypothetical protein
MTVNNKTTKPQPGQYHSRARWQRITGGLLATAIGVTIVYSLYWNILADEARVGFQKWADARRAEGYTVEFTTARLDGFPWRIRVVITDPVVSNPAEGWQWRGPSLTLSTRPWWLDQVQVSAPGRHLVTGKAINLDATAEALEVFVEWDDLVQMRLEAKEIVYRTPPLAGLGRTTQSLSLVTEATGGLPQSIGAAAMTRWRDQGGTVEIRSLAVRHGSLEIDGNGTLALNGDLQPVAAATLGMRGFIEVVDGLRDAGAIKAGSAELVKTVLAVLARGNGEKLKIPLSIQDGSLYIGPAMVARIPRLNWPGADSKP